MLQSVLNHQFRLGVRSRIVREEFHCHTLVMTAGTTFAERASKTSKSTGVPSDLTDYAKPTSATSTWKEISETSQLNQDGLSTLLE